MSGDYEQVKSRVCQSEGMHVTMRPLASSWEQRKLGDVGTFRRGERFTADDYAEDGIPCIHYGEIYTSYGARAEETFSHLRPELAGSLRYAHPGELVIACTSENVEDVCKAVAWCGSCDVAIHDDSFAFSHSGDPDFFSALTQSPAFYDQKARAAHGVKVMRVSSEALEKMDVAVPSRDEQKQIGSVFRNLDSLITLHQREPPRMMKEGKNANQHQRRVAFLRLLLAMD